MICGSAWNGTAQILPPMVEAVNAILVEAAAAVTHLFEDVGHLLQDALRLAQGRIHAQAQVGRVLGFDGGRLLLIVVAPGEELHVGREAIVRGRQQDGVGPVVVLRLDEVLRPPHEQLRAGRRGDLLDHLLRHFLDDFLGLDDLDLLLDDLLLLDHLGHDLLDHLRCRVAQAAKTPAPATLPARARNFRRFIF